MKVIGRLIFFFIFIGFPIISHPSKRWEVQESKYKVEIFSRRIAQGEVLYLKVIPKEKSWLETNLKVFAGNLEIPVSYFKDSWIAWIPIHPEENTGSYSILLEFSSFLLPKSRKGFQLNVEPTKFQITQSLSLDKKFTQKVYDEETLKFIEECRLAKEQAFQFDTPIQFHSGFVYPVANVSISSPFYARRIYNKEKGKPHGGVDFRGKPGTPIYAINSGTVVLARDMYFEGKFTIIDHGNRIFSLYMHQSKILVKPGQKVKKGQKIGEIGSTGMSTGPHLHLGLRVNGIYVDPLSILEFQSIP